MAAPLDVYLFPARIGGGRGDIEEVLNVGRHLRAAGYALSVYRTQGRPMPPGVDRSFEWPEHRRRRQLRARSPRAVTVAPHWGITAAPARPEPLGGAGPWSSEREEIEALYGAEATVHISLEEFGRTFTSAAMVAERYREAGRPLRWIRPHVASRSGWRERSEMHAAYRRFRGFDTRNVAHLFPGFVPVPAFRREFPEAILCGPVSRAGPPRPPGSPPSRRSSWLWYASPGSSDRLLRPLLDGLADLRPVPSLHVASGRRLEISEAAHEVLLLGDSPSPARWQEEWRRASVRIVSGSRSLVEAVQYGGPFLYFNGVTGRGAAARVHRPEKLLSLLRLWRLERVPSTCRRDLSDFARTRNVRAIVRRAQDGTDGGRVFPQTPLSRGFSPPAHRGELLILDLLRRFSIPGSSSTALVAESRARSTVRPSSSVSNP